MVPVIGGTFLASIDRGIINANLSFPVDGTFRTQIIYNSVSSVCSEQFTITGAAYLAWLYQPIANVSFGLNFVQPPSVQAFDLNGNNATFFEDTVQLQIFNDSLCTNLDSSGILSPESMTASLGIADFPKMTYSKFGSFYFRAISLKTAISTNCSDLFTVFGVNPRIKWNVEPASSELGIFPFSVELSDTVIPLIGSNCTAMLFTDNFCRLAAKSWLIGNSGLSDKGGICSITNFMMTSNTPGSYYVGVESNGYLVCGSKPVQLQSYVTINLLKNNLTVFAGGLIDPISASVRDLKSVVCTVKFYTDSLCSVAIDFTLDNVASTDSSSICKFSSLRVNTVGNYYIGISAGVSEVSCSAFFISVIAKESIKWKVAPLGGSAKFSPVNSFAVNTTDDYGNFLVNATVYVTIHAYPYCSGPELTFVSPNTNLTDNFGVATFGNLIVDTPEASSYFIKARVGNAFICSASAITIGAFNLVTSWKEIPSCDTTVGTFCDPLTVTAIDTTLIAGGNKCRVCNAKLYSDTLCNQTVSGVGNIWSTTDEFGVCTFPSLTYDVPGIYSVRVVSGSVYTGCSPLSLKFSLGNLTRIQWDTPPTATSRGLLPFSVNLTDTVRPLTSVTCSASVYQDPYCANPANVTIAGNSSISDENGQCKFSNFLVPSYTSASYYIGVNYGQNLVCTSNTVLFQSYITFPSIPEVTVEAGSIVDPISAFVFDTNPVNCSISFYTDQSCLSSVFSSSNVETNSNGYCTFSNLQIQGAGKYYVGLSVGSTISICSTSSVTVIAKEAISWNSAPYGGSALGSPINEFSVNTTDEFNNFRVNATVSVSIFIYPNCTGPELTFLSSNSNLTDNFGVATFNTLLVNSSEVSSYYLKASAGNASICSSSPITVGHENIITAWKTVPSCNATVTTLCDSASLNVLVYDLSDLAGNACRACTLTAYADDTCTTPITSGYYGNSAITDSDGLCNFSQLSFYFTGNYSVKVSSGSVSTGCSPLSMQIQPIGSISWITQPHCQETSCDPFSAIVRDQNSVPIPSVACTFGIFGDSSCSSSLATTVTAYTDSSGICSSSSFPTSDQGLYSFAAFVEDTKSPCSNNTVWNIIHSYQAYDDSYHLVVDDYENIVYEEWSSRTLRNLTNMNSLLQTAISPFTGMTIDKDGNIYCTLMNNPNLFYHNATSLEWTQVTGVMPTPNGMGLDETGQKIYICASNKIFVYDLTSRQLSIFNAALGITCQSIAVTSDGRIWLSDGTTYLSVVNSTTVINLVGGGSTYDGKGLNAILANTKSITTDGTNIYTVDSDGGTLRMIDANLNVYTIAGTRNVHNSIDGAGKRALFYFPTGIAEIT